MHKGLLISYIAVKSKKTYRFIKSSRYSDSKPVVQRGDILNKNWTGILVDVKALLKTT